MATSYRILPERNHNFHFIVGLDHDSKDHKYDSGGLCEGRESVNT